jgi:putative copper resistance protein D
LLSGAALAAFAFVGHGADGAGLVGVARLGLMATHLLAVGAWLGALAPLARALAQAGPAAPRLLERFGAIAAVAVTLVVATGLGTLAWC